VIEMEIPENEILNLEKVREILSKADNVLNEVKKRVYMREEKLRDLIIRFLFLREGVSPVKNPLRGILLYGPPGTGKTCFMRAIMEVFGLKEGKNLFIIRGPEILSPYYGRSERKLRMIFRLAENAARKEGFAMIFIDEIDAIALKRDYTRGELEIRLVGQLLGLMDGLRRKIESGEQRGHVIIVAATNKPELLDEALRRPGRFDLEIEFEVPDKDDRKKILDIILKYQACVDVKGDRDEILSFVAEKTDGFTGADLYKLVTEAAFIAIAADEKSRGAKVIIEKIHFEEALKKVKPSILREYLEESPEDFLKDDRRELFRENLRKLNFEDRDLDEIEKKINDRINDVVNRYKREKRSMLIFIHVGGDAIYESIARKIAYTIASRVSSNGDSVRFIRVNCPLFMSKWLGETEHSIEKFFGMIKRLGRCVVYMQGLDAILNPNNENLRGAYYQTINNLIEICDIHADKYEVLILAQGGADLWNQLRTIAFDEIRICEENINKAREDK